MNWIMKPRYLIGLTVAAGLMAVAAPAQAPSFAMLGTLEKGQWSLVERGQSGAAKNICLGDATQLLQTEHPGVQLQMVWHAAALLPQIPDEGVAYQAFYEARLGSAQAVAARRAERQAAG